MKHLPLLPRLLLGFLLVAVLPLIGLTWFHTVSVEQALTETVLENISSVADKKAQQINTYIDERLKDAQIYGQLPVIHNALKTLTADFQRGGLPATQRSNEHYRKNLKTIIELSQFHDLLLIDAVGNVVFSMLHETDLGSNLLSGPYRNTGLAAGYQQAMSSQPTDLIPFAPYEPSANKVAGFMVTPVIEGERIIGAIAFKLSIDALMPVVGDRTGLGKSGETVLAQQLGDEVLYTINLDRVANAAFRHRVPLGHVASPMRSALRGEHSHGLTVDYAGIEIVASWRYLPKLRWGMVVKIDSEEALKPARRARVSTLLSLGFFLFVAALAGVLLGRRFIQTEGIIAAQEHRYRAMFGSMNDGVALYRPLPDSSDFIFLDFNHAAERITQTTREAVLGRPVSDVFPGVKETPIFGAFQRVAASGVSETVSLTNYQDQRLSLWVENDVMRLSSGDVLSVFKDITARKQAEEALQLYANIFEHSGEAILVTDKNNTILTANLAFTRLTGYTQTEVVGKNPRLLSSGRTPPETYQSMWATLQAEGFWQGELWDRHKDGNIYPKWAAISLLRNIDGEISHHIASFTDITERKATEERISHLAHHDALTGLFNRYNLESRLGQALVSARREGEQVAVLFIDMDRFKLINDTLGHHIGDQLLIAVAGRLLDCVRESDIVARLGGDEFVAVITGLAQASDAAPVAAKILHALGQPYTLEGTTQHSTPSIGISLFPNDGSDAEILMKNADTAMYHAKAQGRNNLQYFTTELNAAAAERLELERDLRVAINEGHFVLHYQPQIGARDLRLCGVEALVRWQHPQRGLVPPLKFIPIAEETGLIEEIGAWVLEEACRQQAEWKRSGLLLRMAVNISAHQLRAADLVDRVSQIMQHHALGPHELELEITESVAMTDPQEAVIQLHALHSLGVDLAIDDFGTGYSSLAYLKRLPIQALKLDREFVRDIEVDANDSAISTATLALAHSLGLQVVAEGVETQAQQDFLTAHRCDLLQGYLISRPLPAGDLLAWARDWPHYHGQAEAHQSTSTLRT